MKKFFVFFVFIYRWVVALFSPKPKVKQQEAKKKYVEENREIDRRKFRHKVIPQHNNRKNTRGRKTQHIYGHSAIYHDPMRKPGTV